jgi:hypothetical protein
MPRKLIFLSLLLLVQLGLALGLGLNSQQLETFDATEKLLPFTVKDVDQMIFSDSNNTEITLQKQGSNWTLPARFGAQADGPKVADLLQNLIDIRRPWPVAENGATDSRFKAADDNFDLRLNFMQGGKSLGTLLLGSSPGFRKVYARVSGEEKIYAIPFSRYQASLKPEDWLDKRSLQVNVDQISSIELPFGRLTRQGKVLQLDELNENERTDEQKADELAGKLANLTILDIAGKSEQSLSKQVELSISLTLQEDKIRDYRLLKGEQEGDLLLHLSDQPYLYKVSPGLKDELLSYTRESLVKTVDQKEPPQNTDTKPPSAG